jgi:hypothetical protein
MSGVVEKHFTATVCRGMGDGDDRKASVIGSVKHHCRRPARPNIAFQLSKE